MQRIRCFVAVDIEDSSVISKIRGIQEQLEATGARLKLVEPQNLHLTLRFIGEVERELVNAIIDVLRVVEFKPFKIRLLGVGAFPNARRPRVIWVGVKDGFEELVELSRRVNEALARLKIPRPREKYVPHLTIARVKGGAARLSKLLQDLSLVEVGNVYVKSFRLKKSTLTPRGPIYETLYERGVPGS